MKIDAGDQPQQLVDYSRYIQEQAKQIGKESKLYYLTLDGREASDVSCVVDTVTKEKVPYISISFREGIKKWLDECIIETSEKLSFVRESLIQYKNLILKITGQSEEEIKMEIANVINTPEMAKSATEIAKNISYIWAKKEAEFWIKVSEEIQVKYNNNWDIKYCSTKLYDYKILESSIENDIEQARKNSSKTDVGLVFQKNNIKFFLTETNTYEPYFSYEINQHYLEALNFTLECQENGTTYYCTPSNTKIYFYGSLVVNPSFELFDDAYFKNAIETIAHEIIDYLQTIDT